MQMKLGRSVPVPALAGAEGPQHPGDLPAGCDTVELLDTAMEPYLLNRYNSRLTKRVELGTLSSFCQQPRCSVCTQELGYTQVT